MQRGEVWWVNFEHSVGGEIRKKRPGVIISNDASKPIFESRSGRSVNHKPWSSLSERSRRSTQWQTEQGNGRPTHYRK